MTMGGYMESISTEQKLELVKQIRSKYNENLSDLNHRERILYGRTSSYGQGDIGGYSSVDRSWYYDDYGEGEDVQSFSFGKVRFLIAVILVTGVITLDLSGKSLMGVPMNQVFAVIAQDYEDEIAAWVTDVTSEDTMENDVSDVNNTNETMTVQESKKE